MLNLRFNAVCVAVETGLLASVVLSTLFNPTIVLLIPLTVPVKVGEAIGAFKLILLDKVIVSFFCNK